MEPIISPWFIYLLGVISAMGCLIIVLIILCSTIALCCGIAYLISEDDFEEETYVKLKKWIFRGIVWAIVFSVISVFTPSRNTLIAMYVVDNITPDNVASALEVGKDFKDEVKKDIIELIDALQKESKDN